MREGETIVIDTLLRIMVQHNDVILARRDWMRINAVHH